MNATRHRLSGMTGATEIEVQSIGPEERPDEPSRARLVAQHAESIRRLHRSSLADIVEMGRRLSECKSLLSHGDWLPWLQCEFAWSEKTVRNYIRAYEALAGTSANVADFAIDLSSVYLIAAPSTPPEARAEVISRARAGEVPSRDEVKRIVHEAKQHQPTLRRASPRIGFKEVSERTGTIVLRKLSNVERDLHLEIAMREGPEIALEWAESIASFSKKYQVLSLGLDFLETASKLEMRKMLKAILDKERGKAAERARVLSEFLSHLRSKLVGKWRYDVGCREQQAGHVTPNPAVRTQSGTLISANVPSGGKRRRSFRIWRPFCGYTHMHTANKSLRPAIR